MSGSDQTDSRLSPNLEYFTECLNLVFSYFFFTLEFEHDEALTAKPGKDSRAWAVQTIHNACLHTTLIALRQLDEFLTPRRSNSRPDDLKASDFGMAKRLAFLSEQERKDVDKLIAHITLHGVQSQRLAWHVHELATKAVSQCLAFLRWIENQYGVSHFLLYTAAVACRKKTESIVKCMSAVTASARRDKVEQCAPPNGGPAAPLGNSGVTEGP